MGGFRLGSHRKARGQQPPVPAAAPGNGRPAAAVDGGNIEAPSYDFGSMANPLAQSARKASKADVWGFAGTRPAQPQPTSFSRPGRAERPRWTPSETASLLSQEPQAPVVARWQPPAAAPAPEAPAGGNGHVPTGIQPARRAADPEPEPEPRRAEVPADPAAYQRNGIGGPVPQGAWAAGLADQEEDSWDDEVEYDDEVVPRVLVLDRVGDFSTDIARATLDLEPSPEILRLSRSTQVIDVVEQEEPDVIVVAPEEMTGAGLKRLAQIHRHYPKIVIVLSESIKPVTPAQTAACGSSDIIPLEITKGRLRTKMKRALHESEELRQESVVVTQRVVAEPVEVEEPVAPAPAPFEPPPAPSPPAAFSPQPKSSAARTGLARVFTVASASGGCGKTFYSTNFAAYLAKATGGKVLLVDLDLQFGEVAISLHLRPKRTIAELVLEDDIAAALSDYVVDHGAGYQVLCAPRDPIAGDRVGPRETTMVLEAARAIYDYIVVDTPPSLNETCLAAFDQSQSLVIMATMDLPSLKNLRVFLETLKKLNLPADQVSLIVNKAESGTGIDLREVEPLYPQGFSSVLPYAKQVSWSINMGMPVLVADPNADISRKLAEGAVKLVPPIQGRQIPWSPASVAEPRRGWFSRLMKGNAK